MPSLAHVRCCPQGAVFDGERLVLKTVMPSVKSTAAGSNPAGS